VTTPTGHDIDDAAAGIVDAIVDSVVDMPPVDRYDRIVWWRQVLVVAAQRLTAESGFPLMVLAQSGLSHQAIADRLAEDEIRLSSTQVGNLIRATGVTGQLTR